MKDPIKRNSSATSLHVSIDRRRFCTSCFRCSAGMILLTSPGILLQSLVPVKFQDEEKPMLSKQDIRKLFIQKGSCSHLFLYILNHEYGHNKGDEERAIDQLAGGIAERGYQCGMLWGTSMGASAEAYRIYKNKDLAIASAVFTSKQVIDTFVEIISSPDCYDITNVDLSKKLSKLKMVLSAGDCISLANYWYPIAIETTDKYLSQNAIVRSNITTCASEVVRKMGGSDEEMVMVSGFAGGLGLSGNACGALSAAIWMKTLEWCRKNPEEKGYSYGGVKDIVALFEQATQGEMLCHNIAGRRFNTIDDHTEFIQKGGCEQILNLLAETKTSVE